MSSVNRVTLIGNLGKDPEVRYMANGDAVANVTVATTDTWKDKEGQKQEKTEWHRVTFYRKLAEIVEKYLNKGSAIYIEGRLETRKWTDKQGNERYTTEVIASEMKMLGGKKEGGKPEDKDGKSYHSERKEPPVKSGTQFDEMEDDIPF